LCLLLPPLAPSSVSCTVVSHGTSLPLLGVAYLFVWGRMKFDHLVAGGVGVATLHSSSLVYLKMSFGAGKGGGYYASCTPHSDAFIPSHLGSRWCPSSRCVCPHVGFTCGIWVVHLHPPGEFVGELGARRAGPITTIEPRARN
jgi:hypothetical protein